MLQYVFVYGTLMTAMVNHHVIADYAAAIISPAWLYGRLYHLHYGFPALIEGTGNKVYGELIEITNASAALAVLDELEDYYGPGDGRNMYKRLVRPVYSKQGVIYAYVYVWADKEKLPLSAVKVAEGNWHRFISGSIKDQ